jgi:hypothetical protein
MPGKVEVMFTGCHNADFQEEFSSTDLGESSIQEDHK